jgi:nucleoid-associated protein YgaU
VAKAKTKQVKSSDSKVRVERPTTSSNFPGRNFDFSNNRSVVNLVLGAAVLVVLGVVLFNFLSSQKQTNQDLGPSQQTENTQTGDVAKENLPGKYTIKEGDTLFIIAQKYYDDGYKFSDLAKANKILDENNIQVGQVLDIPKLETAQASPTANSVAEASPTTENEATEYATPAPQAQAPAPAADQSSLGTGGDPSQTAWGSRITTDTYTVVEGDWLSKIAGRSYGDIMQFSKIAQANNITDPNQIVVGMVIKIPR